MLDVSRLEYGFGYLKICWGYFKLIIRLYLIQLPDHGISLPSTITLISRFLVGRSILPHISCSSLGLSLIQNLTLFLFELLGHLVTVLGECTFDWILEANILILRNFPRSLKFTTLLGFLLFNTGLLPFTIKPLPIRLGEILISLFLVFCHATP